MTPCPLPLCAISGIMSCGEQIRDFAVMATEIRDGSELGSAIL
jgi:hypothetical protein